ncbi:hypothetical protein BGW42_003696 [Actinomortierella wolfii]|nr:hypothetical protein BGW42_003696 [Actinomortierella wolfii]
MYLPRRTNTDRSPPKASYHSRFWGFAYTKPLVEWVLTPGNLKSTEANQTTEAGRKRVAEVWASLATYVRKSVEAMENVLLSIKERDELPQMNEYWAKDRVRYLHKCVKDTYTWVYNNPETRTMDDKSREKQAEELCPRFAELKRVFDETVYLKITSPMMDAMREVTRDIPPQTSSASCSIRESNDDEGRDEDEDERIASSVNPRKRRIMSTEDEEAQMDLRSGLEQINSLVAEVKAQRATEGQLTQREIFEKIKETEERYEAKLQAMEDKHEIHIKEMVGKHEAHIKEMERKYEAKLKEMEEKYETKISVVQKKADNASKALLQALVQL